MFVTRQSWLIAWLQEVMNQSSCSWHALAMHLDSAPIQSWEISPSIILPSVCGRYDVVETFVGSPQGSLDICAVVWSGHQMVNHHPILCRTQVAGQWSSTTSLNSMMSFLSWWSGTGGIGNCRSCSHSGQGLGAGCNFWHWFWPRNVVHHVVWWWIQS